MTVERREDCRRMERCTGCEHSRRCTTTQHCWPNHPAGHSGKGSTPSSPAPPLPVPDESVSPVQSVSGNLENRQLIGGTKVFLDRHGLMETIKTTQNTVTNIEEGTSEHSSPQLSDCQKQNLSTIRMPNDNSTIRLATIQASLAQEHKDIEIEKALQEGEKKAPCGGHSRFAQEQQQVKKIDDLLTRQEQHCKQSSSSNHGNEIENLISALSQLSSAEKEEADRSFQLDEQNIWQRTKHMKNDNSNIRLATKQANLARDHKEIEIERALQEGEKQAPCGGNSRFADEQQQQKFDDQLTWLEQHWKQSSSSNQGNQTEKEEADRSFLVEEPNIWQRAKHMEKMRQEEISQAHETKRKQVQELYAQQDRRRTQSTQESDMVQTEKWRRNAEMRKKDAHENEVHQVRLQQEKALTDAISKKNCHSVNRILSNPAVKIKPFQWKLAHTIGDSKTIDIMNRHSEMHIEEAAQKMRKNQVANEVRPAVKKKNYYLELALKIKKYDWKQLLCQCSCPTAAQQSCPLQCSTLQ